ncbi:MAG TPA: hypothetical protein VLF21_00785 [Candidatus Saccharimonadales bacterium]|nr:hypothetical protein [Candidatus Saccharimonadales bacterium]
MRKSAFGGGFYFLVFIGASVYYLENAHSFGQGFIGLVKALFWPAVVAFQAFTLMHM